MSSGWKGKGRVKTETTELPLTSDSSPPPGIQHLTLLPRGTTLRLHEHSPRSLLGKPCSGAMESSVNLSVPLGLPVPRKRHSLTRASGLGKLGGLNRTMCRKPRPGISLPVQWLKLHASSAGGAGLIPGWGTKTPHSIFFL